MFITRVLCFQFLPLQVGYLVIMSESIANIISGKPYKLLLRNNNYLCSDITYRKLRSVNPLIQSFQPVDHDNQVSFYRRYSAFHVNGSKHNTRAYYMMFRTGEKIQ